MIARNIVRLLNGKWMGRYGIAPCPAHDDNAPSFSISEGVDGKVLVHCFAGCEQVKVIAALKSRGLWGKKDNSWSPCPAARMRAKENKACDDVKRTEAALAIWQSSKPATETLVERYLASRGLLLPPTTALRFHPHLRHASGHTWPAMIALVTRGSDATPIGIHRTFLGHYGTAKAPVDRQKMMLGPCHGGGVRLAEPTDELMIGEGIETCLAAMQATGKPAWAALSTSGMRALELPSQIRDVIVLADGDDPGEAAAQDCALRWKRKGRRVRIARPPTGVDFNDLLLGRIAHVEETTP